MNDQLATQHEDGSPIEDQTARDHFVEQPADWVAGCCDRGVRHARNEDALALAADAEPDSKAVLVVCDGVSTSLDSDVGSLAASTAARDFLVAGLGFDAGLESAEATVENRAAALAELLNQAAAAAHTAVMDSGPADQAAASSTLVAAVVERGLVVYGNIGDSRAYWLPDSAPALLLTQDDSVAQVRLAAGVPREQAETGPGAHAITRWLGAGAEDTAPHVGALEVLAPGWVLLCSDGLWNYASEPADLRQVVDDVAGTLSEVTPLGIVTGLVNWANEQGGKDNVTVAVARISG